jgi:hypothetical protein
MLRNYILNIELDNISGGNYTYSPEKNIVPMCAEYEKYVPGIPNNPNAFKLEDSKIKFIPKLKSLYGSDETTFNKRREDLEYIVDTLEKMNNSKSNYKDNYNNSMNYIHGEIKRVYPKNPDKIDWDKLPNDNKLLEELNFFRVCIVCVSFITASKLRTTATNSASVYIIGSITLKSDIDCTILSKNASGWISSGTNAPFACNVFIPFLRHPSDELRTLNDPEHRSYSKFAF